MRSAELIERYMRLPRRQRALGMGGVVLLVLVIFYGLSYGDQRSQQASLNEELERLEGARQEKQLYANNLTAYKRRFDELTQNLAQARLLLPDSSDVAQFLDQIGSSARDVGLSVDRFEPHDESVRDFYAEIVFRMSVHGTYHEIAMFIDQVARSERIVNVTNLSMGSPQSDTDKAVVQSTFFVKTYRFLSDAAVAAAAAAAKKPGGGR